MDIQHTINEVNDLANTISNALREQSSASQLIAQQVERIARTADESQHALNSVGKSSHHLDTASQQLVSSVALFKV